MNVTLYLDEELVNQAKQSGLNLSKVMENTLRNRISLMDFPRGSTWTIRNNGDNTHIQNKTILKCLGAGDGILEPAWGLSNPRPLDYESNALALSVKAGHS